MPNFFQACQRARLALHIFRYFRTLAAFQTFFCFCTLARTSSHVRPIMMLGRHRCPTCKIQIVSIRKQSFFKATGKELIWKEKQLNISKYSLRPSQIILKGLFINKDAKIRFGTELKLSICNGIALGGRVGA